MKKQSLLLCILFAVAYVLLLWQDYDMYIGTVFMVIINAIHILSALLFSVLLALLLKRSFPEEDMGMYVGLLVVCALCNGLFAMMNWGCCVGLALSVLALLCLLFLHRKRSRQA